MSVCGRPTDLGGHQIERCALTPRQYLTELFLALSIGALELNLAIESESQVNSRH